MKNLTLLITLIFSSHLYALDCSDTNLYDSNPMINNIKIEFQGDMNTCYAHSLAQNYNITKAQDSEDKINAYWVAFIHKNKYLHWNPKDMDFSLLAWAWKDLKKIGKCNYSILENKIAEYKRGTPYNHDQFFFLMKYYFKLNKERKDNSTSEWNKLLTGLIIRLKKETEKFTYPWVLSEIQKVLEPIKEETLDKTFFDYLGESIYADCANQTNPIHEELDIYGMYFDSNDSMAKKSNAYLQKGRPISIGHCPDVTYDPGATNRPDITTKPRLLKSLSTKCGAHYALIVGSRNNDQNKCEYLIRNSYGKGFWADKSITCYCEDNTSKDRFNCRKENFNIEKQTVLGCWINGDKLLTNTYEMDVFN